MEKTELELIRTLFRNSDETPYREFRQAIKQEYDFFYDPEEYSFDKFREEKIEELIGTFKFDPHFDPPKGIDKEMYKNMHIMKMTFIYLFPETMIAY
jgi:hypothetical protein